MCLLLNPQFVKMVCLLDLSFPLHCNLLKSTEQVLINFQPSRNLAWQVLIKYVLLKWTEELKLVYRFILEVVILFPYMYPLKVTSRDFYFDVMDSRDTVTEQLSDPGQAVSLLWASFPS